MSLETIDILVVEEVDCFQDKWDYTNETHYTTDWVETVETVYRINVELDNDGEILETPDQIERKILDVIDGKLISYEIL